MQAGFAELGKEIETAQKGSDFPMNVRAYEQSLESVKALRQGYQGLAADGTKIVKPGLDSLMQSTGMVNVSTLKLTDSTAQFTKSLMDQKVGLGQVIGNFSKFRTEMAAATKQQVALQKSSVMQWTSDGNTSSASLYVPKDIPNSLVDLKTKYGMINYAIGQIGQNTLNWGKNTQWAGRQITAGLSMPIALVAAGLAKLAITYDTELTKIVKMYSTDAEKAYTDPSEKAIAKEQELAKVRQWSMDNAIAMAKNYGVAIKDTLDIEAQMASKGYTGNNLQQMTNATMKLSSVGSISPTDAMNTTMSMISAYKIAPSGLDDAMNFLNALKNNTNLTMQDISAAIPKVGATLAALVPPTNDANKALKESGVMLAAFAEGGVTASLGANALKTAIARAMDPVPKATKEFDTLNSAVADFAGKGGQGIDLTKIKTASGGDPLTFFTDLGKAMQNVDAISKETALKDLFGIQQSNRMLVMLQNLMNGSQDPNSQTGKAMALSNANPSVWANITNQEVEEFRASASGQFKIAVESLKGELAKLGDPIMHALTPVLGVLQNFIGWFVNAPSIVKKAVAGFAIVAVIAGPLIMLTGLFGNLLGNAMKLGSFIGNLFLKFKPLNEEQRAAAELAKLSGQNYDIQTKAVSLLAQKMEQLNVIMKGQIAAQKELITGQEAAATQAATNPGLWGAGGTPVTQGSVNTYVPPKLSPQRGANGQFVAANAGLWGEATPPVTAEEAAASAMLWGPTAEQEAAAKASADAAKVTEEAAAGTAASSEKTGHNLGKAAGYIGSFAMGGVFLKQMLDGSGGVANNLLMGTLAFSSMLPTITKVASIIKDAGGLMAIFGTIGTGVLSKIKVGWEAVSGGVMGFGSKIAEAFKGGGLSGVLGMFTSGVPGVLLLTGAIAALGAGFWALHEHVTEEQRAQDALNKSSQAFADIMGVTMKATAAGAASSSNEVVAIQARNTALDKLTAKYGDVKDALSQAYGDMDKAYKVAENVALRFASDTNASSDQIRQVFEIAMQGAGATPMQLKAADVKFGSVNLSNKGQITQTMQDEIQSSLDDAAKNIKPTGFWNWLNGSIISDKSAADFSKVGTTLVSAMNDSSKTDLFKLGQDFSNQINSTFDSQFKAMQSDPKIKAAAAALGANNMNDIMTAFNKAADEKKAGKTLSNPLQSLLEGVNSHAGTNDSIDHATEQYTTSFGKMRDAIGKALNVPDLDKWKSSITTMPELLAKIIPTTMTVTQAADDYQKKLNDATASGKHLSDAQKLELLNTDRVAAGLDKATSATQGFSDAQSRAALAAEAAGSQFSSVADAALVDTSTYVASATQYTTMMKNAYSGAIQADVSEASTLWSRAESNAQTAIQNAGDARQKGMQAAQKAQDRAYDDQTKASQNALTAQKKAITEHYDDLGKQYDAQIKQAQDAAKAQTDAIQATITALSKEDTARQALFNNEKTRLQRMAQLQTNGIDFNSALNSGNLDAAAKVAISNQSTVSGWAMDDQQSAMDNASKAQQDALTAQINQINDSTNAYVQSIQDKKSALSDLQQAETDAADAAAQATQDQIAKQKQAYDDGMTAALAADQKRTQSAITANTQQWQDRQNTMNLEISAITASIPATKQAYDAQVAQIDAVYQKYGVNLKADGNTWGAYVADSLTQNIQNQAAALQSDVGWTQIGDYINYQMSNSAGWTIDQVSTFLKTGNWPQAAATQAPTAWIPSNYSGPAPGGNGIYVGGHLRGYHGGGMAHSDRAGYPVNAPLFSSEYLTLLEKGEFVVNKQASQKHQGLLEAINSGTVEAHHDGGFVGMMGSLVANTMLGEVAMEMMVAKKAATLAQMAAQRASVNRMVGAPAGSAPTNVTGNQAIVKNLAASTYGWTGAEWDALYAIIMQESGFRNTAQNPTSTAYGMFQFLNSTWAGYGVPKTSDPTQQTIAGLRYIAARYRDPIGAENHEKAYHWYDRGGYLQPGGIGLNGTGKPEPVFTEDQWSIMKSLIANSTTMAGAMAAAAVGGSTNVASEQSPQYNVAIDMTGATISKDIDFEKAVYNALTKIDYRQGRSRNVG